MGEHDLSPEALRQRLEAAEAELQLLRTLLDLVPDFFYVHDEDLRFRYANRAAAAYFGRAREDVIGRRLREVERDPEQARFYEKICRQIMREGQPRLTTDLPLKLADGSLHYLRQYDVPFRDPATGRPMLFGLSRDITSEKHLIEERIRRERAERELEIARAVQQSILPRTPLALPGIEVAGRCVPSNFAAGDFYDWWPAPGGDGQAMICLGDVSGHGIGPAILAAACKAYGRALLGGEGAQLRDGLQQLNRAICADLEIGRFITFAALAIDQEGGISFLSAGHSPVLHYAARTGRVESLPTHGLPLGIDADETYADPTRIRLTAGDALLILTDGVPESHAPGGGQFGMSRLMELVAAHAGQSAEGLCRTIVEAAQTFTAGHPAPDDITAVIIRRR
jgi:PAS domain S-box-containing protein